MLFYYYYYRAFRPFTHTGNYVRIVLTLLIGLASPLFSFSQDPTASGVVDDLLVQRSALIAQSQSTRALDLQLFDVGYRPKAIVHIQSLENGTKRITFPTYLVISEERKQRVIDRLTSYYTYLSSMEINTTQQEVSFLVPLSASAAELSAIFDHFGYLGYEEH